MDSEFFSNLPQTAFNKDLVLRMRLASDGALETSEIDTARRRYIMQRRPEQFEDMSMDQTLNFIAYGLPNKDGELEGEHLLHFHFFFALTEIEWWGLHRPLPTYRNRPQLGKGGAFLVNHIPRRSLAYPPISVPWTGCKYAEAPGKFLDYPELMGHKKDELRQGSFGEHSETDGLAFLQSWLFFGILREAFGNDCELIYKFWIEDYDSTESQPKNMASPLLATYLGIIAKRLSDEKERPSWDHWESVFKLFIDVTEAFDRRFAKESRESQEVEPMSLRITWSLLTLGQMLTVIAMRCYQIEVSTLRQWPDSTLLLRRLRRREWCPYTCNKISGMFSMDLLYSISLLSWPNTINRFSALGTEVLPPAVSNPMLSLDELGKGWGRHALCNLKECLGEQIDDSTYRTSHVYDDCPCSCDVHREFENCKCNWVGPFINDVIDVLEDQEVPVFYVRQSVDFKGILHISVDVGRSSSAAGYVAISHVWADGLGNKSNNLLPRCQVIRIAHIVRDLTGQDYPAFWIDTFGIPRALEQRKKALVLMAATYSLSKQVLVLDGGLQQFSSYRALNAAVDTIDVEIAEQVRMGISVELLLRISCSSWTSRLWTLPEGFLGPELHFRFSDGTVELGELYAELRRWPFVGTNLTDDLASFFTRLRPSLRSQPRLGLEPEDPELRSWPSGSPSGRFISMFQALEQRDTSWKEDEAICLGIHLDLDVGKIVSFRPDEEKLEALFAQLIDIPSDLIFTQGSRLRNRPFRWAPLHLLKYMNTYSFVPAANPSRPMGRRTERGLLVKLKSFQLNTKIKPCPDSRFIFLTCPSQTVYQLGHFDSNVPMEEQIKNYGMTLTSDNPLEERMWTQSNTSKLLDEARDEVQRLIIVIGPEDFHGPPMETEQGKVCLIVKVESIEDCVMYARPLDTVVVFKLPGAINPTPDQDSGPLRIWRGMEVSERTFCIG